MVYSLLHYSLNIVHLNRQSFSFFLPLSLPTGTSPSLFLFASAFICNSPIDQWLRSAVGSWPDFFISCLSFVPFPPFLTTNYNGFLSMHLLSKFKTLRWFLLLIFTYQLLSSFLLERTFIPRLDLCFLSTLYSFPRQF